ncbi:MAG: FkbM family methyltransferase [Gemmatimonadaceae bacterium]
MLKQLARVAYAMLHPKGVAIRVNEETIRVSPYIARGVQRRVDALALEPWLAIARNAQCVIDAGANVGVWSALTARVLSAGGVVHAFEPAPVAYRYLADTARVAYGPGRIKAVHAAIGDREGIAYLKLDNETAPTNRLSDSGVTVPMTTIDAYCRANGIAPSAIKVDVEGAEVALLRGAAETLRRHRPVLVLDLHWRDGTTPSLMSEVLETLGYVAHRIDGGSKITGPDALLRVNSAILRPA